MSINTKKIYFGFIGKLLKINLTKKSVSTEEIDLDIARDFIGGAGYACRYLFDLIGKDTNPLSSENVLLIMTGPLCLTSAPSCARIVICSRSPYTGLWGEANAGGFFGPEMKRAGYDGIVISGKAEKPVFLNNFDNSVTVYSFRWKPVAFSSKYLEISEGPHKRLGVIQKYSPFGTRVL